MAARIQCNPFNVLYMYMYYMHVRLAQRLCLAQPTHPYIHVHVQA